MTGNRGFYGYQSKVIDDPYKRLILATEGLENYFPFDEGYGNNIRDNVRNLFYANTINRYLVDIPLRPYSKSSLYFPTALDGGYLEVKSSPYNNLAWTYEFIIKTTQSGSTRNVNFLTNRGSVYGTSATQLTALLGYIYVSGGILGGMSLGADTENVANFAWTSVKSVHDNSPHHVILTWEQAAGSFDWTKVDIYIDGVICSTSHTAYNNINVPISGHGNLRIGNLFTGYLSDLAVYNIKFTADQALAHFHAMR